MSEMSVAKRLFYPSPKIESEKKKKITRNISHESGRMRVDGKERGAKRGSVACINQSRKNAPHAPEDPSPSIWRYHSPWCLLALGTVRASP
jgi:hypothetical protein